MSKCVVCHKKMKNRNNRSVQVTRDVWAHPRCINSVRSCRKHKQIGSAQAITAEQMKNPLFVECKRENGLASIKSYARQWGMEIVGDIMETKWKSMPVDNPDVFYKHWYAWWTKDARWKPITGAQWIKA
jgi:hypothetical protein